MNEPLTTGLFLAIVIPFFFAIITILILLLTEIYRLHKEANPMIKSLDSIDNWLRARGLNDLASRVTPPQNNTEHHSLPLEKAARRDELTKRGKVYGLTIEEGKELESLLREDAQDDFSRGVLNFLAFIAISAAIIAIIKALSKK